MSVIRTAIERPVGAIVGMILVALFGVLAALRLPVQLTPDVDRTIVTVTTRWEGASPLEVEREIIDEQEDQLKSIQGLLEMNSTATEGSATIEMEFSVGHDTDRALLDVADKLRQVPDYPDNVDEPVVTAGETEGASAIAWFVIRPRAGSGVDPQDIPYLRTLAEEVLKPRLERAAGVARVGVVGGIEQEVHVRVDPRRLAARGLTMLDVRDVIRGRNVDLSAGDVEQGKRSYLVRTVGRFASIEEMERLLLARRDGAPVYLRDVGEVRLGYKEPDAVVRSLGGPSIAMNATRQSGTNVLEVMAGLREAVADANERVLAPRGLEMNQVYDQTVYVLGAIDLVRQNLWVGGLLTVAVLMLFLRSIRGTFIVAVAIPISVIGAFLALFALGRNLNVVSLAGLAFAVGMVVDNSIVVLENIHRLRQEGRSAFDAALRGTQEVWGAVLASTLTTLAVFIPVLFVQEEAGQLFRDIAIAISAAVFLSLLVSVLFIPMASARLYSGRAAPAAEPSDRPARATALVALGIALRDGITAVVAFLNRGPLRRLLTVVGLTTAAVAISIAVAPPLSYLPEGNQNLVIGFLIPPPGYNADELRRMGETIEARVAPYWSIPDGVPVPPELARPAWYQGDGRLPAVRNFFYVARGQSVFMGAASASEDNIHPLTDLVMHAAEDIPGTMVFATQRSLFERGLASGNSIDLEVSGNNLPEVEAVATQLLLVIRDRLTPPRPEPSNFNLGSPEIRVRPRGERTAEVGLGARDVGFIVQCMVDGAVVSDFRLEGVNIDVKIVPAAGAAAYVDDLRELPIFTPSGKSVPLSSLANIEETLAPTEIRHIEQQRAVRLVVTPPEGQELSAAMATLQGILAEMRAAGNIPSSVNTWLAGTASKLTATRDAMKWNLLLALVITYLLLCALFEHFLYPIVILFSVPLAAVGGFLGLAITHHYTGNPMDVLTMLGFVILIGTVVNNAILLVHQALNLIREGVEPQQAVAESVRTRIRPIFMSTTTSVLGMLPLVLFPGAGSELYRGLGSVVVGGLVVSTIFTLLVVPTLFGLLLSLRKRA